MKLRNLRSVVTVAVSDEHRTPRPPVQRRAEVGAEKGDKNAPALLGETPWLSPDRGHSTRRCNQTPGHLKARTCPRLPQTSNNIIQKGLAFVGERSGSVAVPGTRRASGSCPAG